MKSFIHTKILASLLALLCAAGAAFAQCKPYDGYIDHKNGTVTDPRTNTVWMVCALGQSYQAGECQGLADEFEWFDAMNAVKAERFLGRSDWRMPTLRDMDSINDVRTNPSCTFESLARMNVFATTSLINKPTNRTFNNTFSDPNRKKTEPDISIDGGFWIATPPENWPLYALVYYPTANFIQGALRRREASTTFVRLIREGTPQSRAEFAQEVSKQPARFKFYSEARARKETASLFIFESDLIESKR